MEINGLLTTNPFIPVPNHSMIALDSQLPWEQQRQGFLDEINQLRVSHRHHLERINHLERVLDQLLTSLEELKQRSQNQEILEFQLANTEEFSSIQQWVIHSLKQQLSQCHTILSTFDHSGQFIKQGKGFLTHVEEFILTQQSEFERIKANFIVSHDIRQSPYQKLEEQINILQETVDNQQKQMVELETREADAQQQVAALELQIQASQNRTFWKTYPSFISQTKQCVPDTDPAQLWNELMVTRHQIEELNIRLNHYAVLQVRLQHTCDELRAERDHHLQKTGELQHQTAEMQEQVLQQVRVIAEYETAVQHWKDRCVIAYEHLIQLKIVLERMFPQQSAELAALLTPPYSVPATGIDAPKLPVVSDPSPGTNAFYSY